MLPRRQLEAKILVYMDLIYPFLLSTRLTYISRLGMLIFRGQNLLHVTFHKDLVKDDNSGIVTTEYNRTTGVAVTVDQRV